MVSKPASGLPPPPSDLDRRKLPLKLLNRPVFRIHRSDRDGLHFGKNSSQRFDDPLGKFGVLYAAMEPEGAFAEVFLRQLSLMLIREQDVQERSLAEIAGRRLQCVDFTGAGLRRLSCDNRIATEHPYQTVGRWSRALYDHPQHADGILYRSRHNPRFRCLALFDRCRSKLTLSSTEGLLASAQRKWTLAQVEQYQLALEPAL